MVRNGLYQDKITTDRASDEVMVAYSITGVLRNTGDDWIAGILEDMLDEAVDNYHDSIEPEHDRTNLMYACQFVYREWGKAHCDD